VLSIKRIKRETKKLRRRNQPLLLRLVANLLLMPKVTKRPKTNQKWARIDRNSKILASCKSMKGNSKGLIIRLKLVKAIKAKIERNQANFSRRLKLHKPTNHGKVNVIAQALRWRASKERHH
jgi:hypothetical protein